MSLFIKHFHTSILRILILNILFFFACDESKRKLKSEILPNALGEVDEIVLVIDSSQWTDTLGLGSILHSILLAPKMGLPQDEARFKVNKVNPRKLNSVLKLVNHIVFVTTLDRKTPDSQVLQGYFTPSSLNQIQKDTINFMRIKKDLFAKGQTAVFLFARTESILINRIKENKERIIRLFEAATKRSIKKKLFINHQKQLAKQIKKNHGITITIPYGWKKARDLKNFVWLRKMGAQTEQSIFLYYEPYSDTSVFNNIDKLRDKITRLNLFDSENPEVHIKRQEIVTSYKQKLTFNGHFAVETRSLWMISDGSRGGPFVSYTLVNKNILYYIEGYVDSPGTPKKRLIRELETILSTFKTNTDR